MIKAAVFDLDGTLMDTLPSIAYYVNYTLNKLGFPAIETNKFKFLAGNGRSLLLRRALDHCGGDTPENFKLACEIYDKAYESDFLYLAKPYDGIIEAVKKIKSSGIKAAVLSNKPDKVVNSIVDAVFGADFFDFVCGQRVGLEIKPNPAGLITAAKIVGAQMSECVMIGDTDVDIETGINGGTHTIGVLWGFRDKSELVCAGAEYTAQCPNELPNIILKLSAR